MPQRSIAEVIHGHGRAIVQLASKHLPEYAMNNDATKCLNTAVALMYALLGKRALRYTRYCDVSQVNQRYRAHDPSAAMARSMAYDVLGDVMHRGGESRHIYYVMLTDGYMPKGGDSATTRVYQPGHVFIIERYGCSEDGGCLFQVYQSFIRRYEMDEYLGKSSVMDAAAMRRWCADLVHLFTVPRWDARCSRFWHGFTHVAGDAYEGCDHRSSMKLCYHKVPMATAHDALRGLLTSELAAARALPPAEPFSALPGAMTNADMARHLQAMVRAIGQK